MIEAPLVDCVERIHGGRDRLVGYANAQHTIAYDHHATGLMASAALDGSQAWRFYYNNATDPQVTNIYEPSTQRWSGYLGSTRFVSDGGEQVLEKPRKDLVCEYDPRAQSVQAHTYDAYGAQTKATPESYDLSENPFQYAGEFRDPLWGGIYLRARWYDPDFPIFLSRDPMAGQLNHYGYAGGNPVMNSDPSGTEYRLGRQLDKLTKGIGGHFARVLLSPALAPLQLAAHPKAFWMQIKNDKAGIDIFLAAGAAAEVIGLVAPVIAPVAVNALSLSARFAVRLGTDEALGYGQAATQAGLTKGFKHFNWHTFLQGAEYTAGGIGWVRLVAGIGYRPFGIKSSELEEFVKAQKGSLKNGEALIFRERRAVNAGTKLNFTTPLQESRNLGLYHERIVAITKEGKVYGSEMLADGLNRPIYDNVKDFVQSIEKGEIKSSKFEFVDRKPNFYANRFAFRKINPFNFPSREEVRLYSLAKKNLPSRYGTYNSISANCQDHAAAVLKQLGVR